MDWIHCNNCYMQPGDVKGRKFWLTDCGHMFCEGCLARGPNDTKGCTMCKKACSARMLIPANLQGELKEYFSTVESLLEEFLKVFVFQEEHRQRLIQGAKAMAKKYNNIKKQFKDLCEQNQLLQKRISEIKLENVKLKQTSASTPSNFRFARNIPSNSPFCTPESALFSSQSLPGSRQSLPQNMKTHDIYGNQVTRESFHITTPKAKTPNVQERTPDFVQQLQKFSFMYPTNSQED